LQAVIQFCRSLDFSAEYCQGLLALCHNEPSFTPGAFPLKQYFSPFFPFRPIVQLHCPFLSLEEVVDDDDDEDNDGNSKDNDGGTHGYLVFSRG
jgi:hypothetical protein